MMAERDLSLPDGSPHPARDRLQADTMFVCRPELDFCRRMLAPLGGDGGVGFF
jgi:hypothetical protein